jgi:hypothetical protein
MRFIFLERGGLFCPAFDGETSERVKDCDLYIGLGAHHDPARSAISPTRIILDQYEFIFEGRIFEGEETLCMTVFPTLSTPPLRSMPHTESTSSMFYNVSVEFYRRAHARGVQAQ